MLYINIQAKDTQILCFAHLTNFKCGKPIDCARDDYRHTGQVQGVVIWKKYNSSSLTTPLYFCPHGQISPLHPSPPPKKKKLVVKIDRLCYDI